MAAAAAAVTTTTTSASSTTSSSAPSSTAPSSTSAAAATNSPHLSAKGMTASPRSNTRSAHQKSSSSSDSAKKEGSVSRDAKADSSTLPSIKQPEHAGAAVNGSKDTLASTSQATANAPLAPPPKPSQNGDSDYFAPGNQSHLSKEPNPFENAFSGSADTPGKSQLPGVASLTSPAPLLPGSTPGWPGSLRSGPLSPAMLTGPANNDYFNSDHHFAGSFPTPNESSLRSGLTPGGGGSMFPQPSPNSQALYNSLQSGGATPGTLDFHRTAMTARAQSQANNYTIAQSLASSQPPQTSTTSQQQQQQQQANPNIQPDLDSKPYNPTNANASQDNHDPFGSHNANDAANGLFMLAQAGGQQRNGSTYSLPPPQPSTQYAQDSRSKHGGKNSIGSTMSGDTDGADGPFSDDVDDKPATRGSARNKKGGQNKAPANGKRKNDETPAKAVNKRQRGSTVSEEPEDMPDMDDDMLDSGGSDKKMTDEEKRKNFLERNRVAALKCRQRKKQWLANLQQKVEIFSTENDALAATVTQLREEIVGLKTLLLAHKDCPVSQAQGISGMTMQRIAGDNQHYVNSYNMAMQGQMPQAQM